MSKDLIGKIVTTNTNLGSMSNKIYLPRNSLVKIIGVWSDHSNQYVVECLENRSEWVIHKDKLNLTNDSINILYN